MTKRKFYRTVLVYEVLSEEPLGDFDLEDLHEMVTDGHCSGVWLDRKERKVGGKVMAAMLEAQGSDPEFFRLDENGDDLDEL